MNFVEKGLNISGRDSNEDQSIDYLNKEKILCTHCQRSLTNQKTCIGMCVADNEY